MRKVDIVCEVGRPFVGNDLSHRRGQRSETVLEQDGILCQSSIATGKCWSLRLVIRLIMNIIRFIIHREDLTEILLLVGLLTLMLLGR